MEITQSPNILTNDEGHNLQQVNSILLKHFGIKNIKEIHIQGLNVLFKKVFRPISILGVGAFGVSNRSF